MIPSERQLLLPDYSKKSQYPQVWKAYDEAKTNEDILLKRILSELLSLALTKEPVQKGYSKADKLFCMVVKIYYHCDSRKAISILKELKNLHYIDKVPCYKSLCNFFNDKSLTKILDELILITSLPLARLEKTGAIDATGISTSKYAEWNQFKWGKFNGKERVWRKLHLLTGCKTNTIISCEVTESNVADVKMFEKILGDKLQYFNNMEDVVADMAYNSRAVFKFIHELGLNPFIPFPKGTTGRPKGSDWIWRQMFNHFNMHREAYMNHYHLRSNVEASIHSIKQRLAHNVQSKTFDGQVNEIKTKVLVHNISVLVQELFENDIKIDLSVCVNKVRIE